MRSRVTVSQPSDFKYLTLSHLNKYTRFIQSYAYATVDTPGSAMHIDEREVEP